MPLTFSFEGFASSVMLGAAVVVASGSAFAQGAPNKQQCVDAYTQAQILRSKDKLVLAKKQLDVCTQPSCSDTLRKDCTAWLAEVHQNLPFLSVDVVDEKGHAVGTAHVSVDGNTVTAGQALEMDPGSHEIQADAPGMIAATQSIDLGKGEKRRATLTLKPQPSAELPPPVVHKPVPVAGIVFASVGAVGAGFFIGFGLAGKSKLATLDANGCKPNCSPSDIDTIKTDYVIADIGLGVGIASLATATVLFILAATSSSPKQEAKGAWSSLAITGSPLPGGGGVVGLGGSY